jgi:hypothetical protein
VSKRGESPSFLFSSPLSIEGEGDKGGEGDKKSLYPAIMVLTCLYG